MKERTVLCGQSPKPQSQRLSRLPARAFKPSAQVPSGNLAGLESAGLSPWPFPAHMLWPGPRIIVHHEALSEAWAVLIAPAHAKSSHTADLRSSGLWWPRNGCNILILGLTLPFLSGLHLGILFWGPSPGHQLLGPP